MINFKSLQLNLKKKLVRIEKRYRFVISVVIISGLILFSTFFDFNKALIFIPILIICSYILTYFSILEGLEKVEWLTLFFIPTLLTVSFYLFYFLFPGRWLTRLPFIIIFAVSFYAVLLCSNIFNVGVEKNLQLYRAAFSVNFFYHASINFIIFNLLFATRQSFIINAPIVGIFGFLMSLHFFWTIKLNHFIDKDIIIYALLLGIIMAELTMIISFIPVVSPIIALLLVATYYSLTGLIYNYLDQRLFKETVREYLIVLGFVLLITILSISW